MSDAEDASAASAELAEGIDEELDGDAVRSARVGLGRLASLPAPSARWQPRAAHYFTRYDEAKNPRRWGNA